MSFPDNSYQLGNPPVGNPPSGSPPCSYPGQAGNGFNDHYPYLPAGYPGGSGYPAGSQYPARSDYPNVMPQPPQGTDLSWLLNNFRRNRVWFIPISLLLILIGYIVFAAINFESPAAEGTGLLFFGAGHALLVAFILAGSKHVGKFTKVAIWVATVIITCGWLGLIINLALQFSLWGVHDVTTALIFLTLTVVMLIGGMIAGSVLSGKPSEPVSAGVILPICLFLLLTATITPVIHAVGMLLLIGATACSVIKPRPAYFVLLGLTALLALVSFIIGLASKTASAFLGKGDYDTGLSMYGAFFSGPLENVGWIYWIIGGLTWAFSLVVLAACILAIYQTISRQPVTDLIEVFRNNSQPNPYSGYYQQGQYPPTGYPRQPYYGGQFSLVPPNEPGQQFSQFQAPQQQSFMPPNPPQGSQPPQNN
ncbi:hypothetical protein [Varibaculum vaginae]|uniref:hypothetical protein n=1 Tax=Varibaculum vaginae TaxID=2364797 RepID=UPI000F08082A|nr:hypothetical protein [Varibaculum vaginae]